MRRGAPGVWPPPTKFRPGIWGVSHGHRPLRGRETEDGGRHAGVVVPYGGFINHPGQSSHSGALAPAGARNG